MSSEVERMEVKAMSLTQAAAATRVSAETLKRNAVKFGFGRKTDWGTWDIFIDPLRDWLKSTGRYKPSRYF